MNLAELLAIFGPGVAGAVFGAGWWFWVDAVVCSSVKVPFVHYLPGIFASVSALMFNCVRKEDIDYSPYEDGEWRLKLWLFIAYVVSFVSLAASVGLLIQDALVKSGPSAWTGVAGVLQCVFVLISLCKTSRTGELKFFGSSKRVVVGCYSAGAELSWHLFNVKKGFMLDESQLPPPPPPPLTYLTSLSELILGTDSGLCYKLISFRSKYFKNDVVSSSLHGHRHGNS
ncbi:hypothetical protein Sango_2336000 [Sesamum angolense]|uniref:Transmembrane protein 50 homolog n=1 Tax=Sesamum angolense TaxID=2727404 RepID=A0AAE1W5Z8_9LAMI|nr:hypothetical protein Sango_2336000 [Sesamum angolense]